MLWLVAIFVLVLAVVGVVVALTLNLVGLVLSLVVAGAIGWLADAIVPGELPFGWLGAIAAGLLGSFLGRLIVGPWGPAIFGIYVAPAVLGAVVLAFVANLALKLAGPADTKRVP